MKRSIFIVLTCVMCIVVLSQISVSAYNYDFSTGADTLAGFGKPTSSGEFVSSDPMNENTRRNKDAALNPPPYFYGSGYIPTDPSSLYHDNAPGGASNSYTGVTGNITDYVSTSGSGISSALDLPPVPGFESSTSAVAVNTAPIYYADGSIGTLYIARTGKTIKVYEGEQLDNLKIGAGHFAMTSAWDGNVGLCGHNRGSSPYFAFVKDLQIGDTVIYTTGYGSRTYEVFNKEQINEYDYSKLGWSAENLITLITCISDIPELRWAAQLREVR